MDILVKVKNNTLIELKIMSLNWPISWYLIDLTNIKYLLNNLFIPVKYLCLLFKRPMLSSNVNQLTLITQPKYLIIDINRFNHLYTTTDIHMQPLASINTTTCIYYTTTCIYYTTTNIHMQPLASIYNHWHLYATTSIYIQPLASVCNH